MSRTGFEGTEPAAPGAMPSNHTQPPVCASQRNAGHGRNTAADAHVTGHLGFLFIY